MLEVLKTSSETHRIHEKLIRASKNVFVDPQMLQYYVSETLPETDMSYSTPFTTPEISSPGPMPEHTPGRLERARETGRSPSEDYAAYAASVLSTSTYTIAWEAKSLWEILHKQNPIGR